MNWVLVSLVVMKRVLCLIFGGHKKVLFSMFGGHEHNFMINTLRNTK
jgi:hypothetical protein